MHKRTLEAAFGVDREDPRLYDLVPCSTQHSGAKLIARMMHRNDSARQSSCYQDF